MEEMGLEYRYISLYLKGKISKEEMEQNIIKDSFHLAKKQMRWFKRDEKIKWFNSKDTDILKKCLKLIRT